MSSVPIEEYRVGIVCALPKEMKAARALLDKENQQLEIQDARDNHNYFFGQIHEHKVVIACLPAGIIGTVAAATVASNMMRTFKGLRFGLMVGIGGGIPNMKKGIDIRLGDIAVSQPGDTHGGVVQYDLGKTLNGGRFLRKGSLDKPPSLLLTAVSSLQSQPGTEVNQVPKYLSEIERKYPNLKDEGYMFPGSDKDHLHCTQCDPSRWWKPVVHYGTIASGNQVVKDCRVRDRLGQEFGALCAEMEVAGLMNDFPCIVIRGICDYADSHKNDIWQEYAALVAAAYAKELLSVIRPTEVAHAQCATDVTEYSRGLNLFDAPNIGEGLFIGREAEFKDIEIILQPQSESPDSTRKVLILGGMGGIGKTQLAITYAKRHCHSYSSIFWLNASTETVLNNSLRVLANRIFPLETVNKLDDNKLWFYVSNWLSERDNTQWLLIFDNHDNPDQYKITKYYPYVAHGSIIITTRQPNQVNGKRIKVKSMAKEEESLRIFATRSGRDNAISDPAARRLAERLDGHPLALATAGAFLSQSSVNFTEYLQQYEVKGQVIDSPEELPDYPFRTLHTTWDLSFIQIERQNVKTACLLKFFAYLDNRDIWYDLFSGSVECRDYPSWFLDLVCDEFAFEGLIQVLTKFCLVEAHRHTKSYSLHACVHDWTANVLNREVKLNLYQLAQDCITSHIPETDWANLSSQKYSRLVPHASRLAQHRFKALRDQYHLFQKGFINVEIIAELLCRKGQYTAAGSILESLLAGKVKALGPANTSTLNTVSNLWTLYRVQGKLAESEQMYMRTLAGYEKALGPANTSTLNTVNNLGLLYHDQGKLAESEQMYMRALAGNEKALGPGHTSNLDTVNNLGILYRGQGKIQQAKKMFQRAVSGREKVLGSHHAHTLEVVNYLHQPDMEVKENEGHVTACALTGAP